MSRSPSDRVAWQQRQQRERQQKQQPGMSEIEIAAHRSCRFSIRRRSRHSACTAMGRSRLASPPKKRAADWAKNCSIVARRGAVAGLAGRAAGRRFLRARRGPPSSNARCSACHASGAASSTIAHLTQGRQRTACLASAPVAPDPPAHPGRHCGEEQERAEAKRGLAGSAQARSEWAT